MGFQRGLIVKRVTTQLRTHGGWSGGGEVLWLMRGLSMGRSEGQCFKTVLCTFHIVSVQPLV